MAGRPRVLLLDLDGPVLDVRRRYYAAHRHAVEGLSGVRRLDADSYWAAKRRGESTSALLGLPADHQGITRYRERWLTVIEADEFLACDTLQPGALDALSRLRAVSERVLITLRTSAKGARTTLERLGLVTLFTRVEIVPHAVGSKAFAFAQHGTTTTPVATVVIGDTEIDIEAGHALGFRTIAVSCGIRTADVLSTLRPTAVVPDLAAAADLLLEDASPRAARGGLL